MDDTDNMFNIILSQITFVSPELKQEFATLKQFNIDKTPHGDILVSLGELRSISSIGLTKLAQLLSQFYKRGRWYLKINQPSTGAQVKLIYNDQQQQQEDMARDDEFDHEYDEVAATLCDKFVNFVGSDRVFFTSLAPFASSANLFTLTNNNCLLNLDVYVPVDKTATTTTATDQIYSDDDELIYNEDFQRDNFSYFRHIVALICFVTVGWTEFVLRLITFVLKLVLKSCFVLYNIVNFALTTWFILALISMFVYQLGLFGKDSSIKKTVSTMADFYIGLTKAVALSFS